MKDPKRLLLSVRSKLVTLTSTIYEMYGKKLRNVTLSLESVKLELVRALYYPMTSLKRLRLLRKRMSVLLIFLILMSVLGVLLSSHQAPLVAYLVQLVAFMLGTMIIIFVGRD
jgi:hypothetical protein